MLRKILSLPDISNWCSERPTGNGFYYHVRYVLYLIKLSYYSKKWRNCEVSYFIQRTGTRLRTLIFQSSISSNKNNRIAYMQIRCSYLVFWFLISEVLLYNYSENLEVEMLAGKPLCMSQYYRIFSACRVPADKRDKLVVNPPNKPNAPRHIIIMHNNQV